MKNLYIYGIKYCDMYQYINMIMSIYRYIKRLDVNDKPLKMPIPRLYGAYTSCDLVMHSTAEPRDLR
jgi:hypothetical protein